MKFDYSVNVCPEPETGNPIVILCPEVLVCIDGPKGTERHIALVDTGADNTTLPVSVARRLGIPTTACRGPHAVAFGGQEIALSFADVVLALSDDGETIRWQARVFFAEVADDAEETIVIGHQGFLDFFTATFVGEECYVQLEPNDSLPIVS